MINLYITRPDNTVLCNDEFFSSYTYRKVKSDSHLLKVLEDNERVEIDGDKIISKFTKESLNLNNISTGCKTLLNVLRSPERVFFIGECGDMILEKLYSLENVNYYSPNIYVPFRNVENKIVVHISNEMYTFYNTKSLYDWWCKYEG